MGARDGLLGLLVGDAPGVPYEFHSADEIARCGPIAMAEPPVSFGRAHHGVPIGTWSDDGAQALVLLETLQRRGFPLDLDDFATGLLRWRDEGFCAVNRKVFDVGIQTDRALQNLRRGVSPLDAGPAGERDNGNGSLMRVLPLALVHTGSDEELVADAFAQSAVTHGHLRSLVCCAFYCLWARRLLSGLAPEAAWDAAVAALHENVADVAFEEFGHHVLDAVDEPVQGSGYVVHSLLAARHLLLGCTNYVDVVTGAIALGDDTDTTAAIAGGLAGIAFGDIPDEWIATIRGEGRQGHCERHVVSEILDPLLATLPN